MEKKLGKKQLWLVGVLVFVAVYYLSQQLFFPSFDKALMKIADNLNKSCPIMVDQITRLDNAVALPKNTFQYNYTLMGEEVAAIHPDSLKAQLESRIVNIVKTSPDMSVLRKNKVFVAFNYQNEQGEFVTKITVTPDMYK